MEGWFRFLYFFFNNQWYIFFSFYGTLNALIICTLISLSIISHARAAYFDPGFVSLPKKGIDFSDVTPNDSLLKVEDNFIESFFSNKNSLFSLQQKEEGWTGM